VYQRAKPAADRLETVTTLKTEADQTSPKDPAGLSPTGVPLLEVRHVGFKWPDGRTALDDISFTVNKGERVGIYGAIGSGKSTLFNILTRLHQQQTGSISIKGEDTRTLTPESVRRVIAYGLQQPLLFSESVRSNLCLGLDDSMVTMEALETAARRAQIFDDITRLPDTWDTLIGEKGIKLSGGQKQRLALARLLMRSSEIIILDDVLSAVDHDTEHRLIKSLLETDAALVIASHRVSILEPCDKVLVLKQGRVIASGKYADVKHIVEAVRLEETSSSDIAASRTEVKS
jgi:ATP-binding cassette subfamily B protein